MFDALWVNYRQFFFYFKTKIIIIITNILSIDIGESNKVLSTELGLFIYYLTGPVIPVPSFSFHKTMYSSVIEYVWNCNSVFVTNSQKEEEGRKSNNKSLNI